MFHGETSEFSLIKNPINTALVIVIVRHKSLFWSIQRHCILFQWLMQNQWLKFNSFSHFYLKKKWKSLVLGSIRAVSPLWREADVMKLFHRGACFCSTDTVERLAHPVKLLLQPMVHSRCGGGSRMWQNNPGMTVTGVCVFFLSHIDTERQFM